MFQSNTLWIAALLISGVVGGLIYNWPRAKDVQQTAQVDESTKPTTDEGSPSPELDRGYTLTEVSSKPSSTLDPLDLNPLYQGDRLLLGGNAMGAYQHYNRLPEDIAHSMDASLILRLAIASEQAGLLERSEQHFRDAISRSQRESIQQIWAMLGIARVWESQDRYSEAISLLSEMYLMYADDQLPAELRLPITQQLAMCLQKQTIPLAQEQLFADKTKPHVGLKEQLKYFWCPTRMEPMLEDLKWDRPSRDKADQNTLKVIQRPIDDAALILVDVQSPMYPLSQLIQDLQRETKLTMDLSPRARSALSGRSIRITAAALPVAMLLDQSIGAQSLGWLQNQDRIKIVHTDEWTDEQKTIFALRRSQRANRYLQLQFPEGIERVAALLHDANVSFALDEYGAAADKYRAAVELQPTGELNAAVYFNQAAFKLSRGEQDAALNDFYLALDQTLSPAFQGEAYSRIGEIEILLGRPDRAITAASRGLRLSNKSIDSNRALMALAKAYLLKSDAYSANQVLFNHASSLTDERSRRIATVLSTHARFDVVEPTSGLQNEGERLVLSLAALQPDDPRDFVEHMMVSRAFAAVGFRSKATDHLSIAAEQVPAGYWQTIIPMELASVLLQSGELNRASETLSTILQTSNEDLKRRALFLDAKIQMSLDNSAKVQQRSKELLALSLDDADRRKALQMLGTAYQNSGQHYSAALCFAGLLPDGDPSAATAEQTQSAAE